MSAEDRWATKAFVERKKNLHAFFKENKRGLYNKDFGDWCDEMGLSDRTGRENYWRRAEVRGIIRVIYEKGQKFWELCNSASAESETERRFNVDTMQYETMPKEEPPESFTEYVKRLKEVNEVRQKMGLKPVKELKKHEQTMAEEKRGTAVRREENRKETLRAK